MKKAIILSSALLLSLGLAGCGSSSDSSSNNSATTQEAKKSSKSEVFSKVYKVGEEADINGVKVKVNNIRYNSGDDVNTPDQGNRYAIVNITITNDSDENIDYNTLDFKFNIDGNSKDPEYVTLDGQNVDDLGSGTLDKGSTLTKDLVGQVPVDETGKKVQLTYQPNSLDDNKLVHFDLNQQ